MNISGNNAYGMYGGKNAQLVNNNTINLGTEGTTDTGMVAMALDKMLPLMLSLRTTVQLIFTPITLTRLAWRVRGMWLITGR